MTLQEKKIKNRRLILLRFFDCLKSQLNHFLTKIFITKTKHNAKKPYLFIYFIYSTSSGSLKQMLQSA